MLQKVHKALYVPIGTDFTCPGNKCKLPDEAHRVIVEIEDYKDLVLVLERVMNGDDTSYESAHRYINNYYKVTGAERQFK